ncbi:hypothetical protein BDB00DRAFT_210499 [Zychaea mexicana]|uniref:uncharacterized protein n=1 Tax=Zychaea mexicana TaxID=64656 RepID=UPI0022FDC430|nr:uncharacterized protein BDB00DRAFT_210499 [Zychaea mexicana]KAI9495690.1 hypothetical protein BDB00DRAFT_210499 [Zychaea mexicana]
MGLLGFHPLAKRLDCFQTADNAFNLLIEKGITRVFIDFACVFFEDLRQHAPDILHILHLKNHPTEEETNGMFIRITLGIIEKASKLANNQIQVVFVMDGDAFPLKARMHAQRDEYSKSHFRKAKEAFIRPSEGVHSSKYRRAARVWVRFSADIKQGIIRVSIKY